MLGLFGSKTAAQTPQHTSTPARAPEGMRIYAVGDIHGRLDCLNDLIAQIERDREDFSGRCILVTLGDYIDRGPHSREVVERLMNPLPADIESVCLMGNHEQALLRYFSDQPPLPGWLLYGGLQTLASYRIPYEHGTPSPERLERLKHLLREHFPQDHLDWIRRRPTYAEFGDYYFVHAGVNPSEPLHEQTDNWRLWIRDHFLHHPHPLEKIIVHGHTISPEPELLHHRIGLDTGAYASGRLTALVLEQDQRRVLQTSIT